MEAVPTESTEREQEWAEVLRDLDSCLNKEGQDFLANLKLDLRAKYDRIVGITGARGVGKSTLGIQMEKIVDYSWHYGRLAFSPNDIIPIFESMQPYQAMQMDEGAEIWGRQDWASKISRNITKEVIGDRYMYSFRTILAPSIYHFDQRAIDMMDYWIKVYTPDRRTRGYAQVRVMHETDYYKKKLPYAPIMYELEFDDLPPFIAKSYEEYKIRKGRERQVKYGKNIREETDGKEPRFIPPDVVAHEIKENPKMFMTNGKYDFRKIYMEYESEGFGTRRSKDMAHILNLKLDDEASDD